VLDVRAINKHSSDGRLNQANKTFKWTFASAGQFAVRYRSLYRKLASACKGHLTRRYVKWFKNSGYKVNWNDQNG